MACENVQIPQSICNQTEIFCAAFNEGTCGNITYDFNGNWTSQTLVTQVVDYADSTYIN